MGFAFLGFDHCPLRGACVWKHLGTRWKNFPFQAGGMAVLLLAMPTKLWSLDRKRMWTHILVPALLKLLTSCYTTVVLMHFRFTFDQVSMHFRFTFDQASMHVRFTFDQVSMHVRFTFDQVSTHVRFTIDQVSTHVRFISNRDSHDDELQVGLRRTMLKFPCYVNRGLWDNLSLPRTTPDKHVELSSVYVPQEPSPSETTPWLPSPETFFKERKKNTTR